MESLINNFNLIGNDYIKIIISIVVIVFVFKVLKEVLGLAVKLIILAVIIYFLLRYTSLYNYVQGILASFNIMI